MEEKRSSQGDGFYVPQRDKEVALEVVPKTDSRASIVKTKMYTY